MYYVSTSSISLSSPPDIKRPSQPRDAEAVTKRSLKQGHTKPGGKKHNVEADVVTPGERNMYNYYILLDYHVIYI